VTRDEAKRSIDTMCQMFGIEPPRLLTRRDIERLYRGMPLVQEAIWKQVEETQALIQAHDT
jgi:hypothetical protein